MPITMSTFGKGDKTKKTSTSVTGPGGEDCKGGTCKPPKKAKKFGMDIFKKKKYTTIKIEKPPPPPHVKGKNYIADPRNLGSMGNTQYGKPFKRVSQ